MKDHLLKMLPAIIVGVSIIIGFYILGYFLESGLLRLGIEINNGLRNFPIK